MALIIRRPALPRFGAEDVPMEKPPAAGGGAWALNAKPGVAGGAVAPKAGAAGAAPNAGAAGAPPPNAGVAPKAGAAGAPPKGVAAGAPPPKGVAAGAPPPKGAAAPPPKGDAPAAGWAPKANGVAGGAAGAPPPNGDGAALVHVAPVLGGAGLALLGELGKVAAVSTYRFASVALAADGGALEVALRGAPGETVALAFAARDGDEYACRAVNATVGDDGTASVTFSG